MFTLWHQCTTLCVKRQINSLCASANEPVDEQSVPAAGIVVDRRPLSTNSRSSSSPSLSERLEDTGGDEADDGAHDTPVEEPTMEMPPDRTMLLAEQVRVLRATLRSAPTPDSWATCVPSRGLGHPGKATPALSEGHLLLLTGGASRPWTLDVADLLTLEALDVLAGPGDPRMLDGGR
ncbi:hypothetical protein MRX96_018145 [Rhipicephalus microplus]